MRLREFQYPLLFEVNFNDPKLRDILDEKISCGFEAETVWEDISDDSYDEDNLSWDDEVVQDAISRREHEQIIQDYKEWITNHTEYFDALTRLADEWKNENEYNYLDDFINENRLKDEYEQWTDDYEVDPDEDDNKRDFIWENYRNEFDDYLSDHAHSDGSFYDEAYDEVSGDHDIDDWASYEYGSVVGMLRDEYGITIDNTGGVEGVAERLAEWTIDYSSFSRVLHGSYHSHSSTEQTFWRVEEDSSISADVGVGAEIISPVFSTPREMLDEMKSLFDFLKSNGATTNDSTGLHVTMSWTEENDVDENKLKMILLLGDQYLLKQFDRESNMYTVSQKKKIRDAIQELKADIYSDGIDKLEDMLYEYISDQKYTSINFKNMKNNDGNNLVEFRIMGNEDYLEKINEIEKTVVRYTVAMKAGYTDAYHKDYIKALIRLFTKKSKVDIGTDKQLEKVTSLKDNLFYNAMKDIISATRFEPFTDAVKAAYDALNAAQKLKSDSRQLDLDLREDDENEGEDRDISWQEEYADYFKRAREYFTVALQYLVMDILAKETRGRVNAQAILQLRKGIKEFGISYSDIWNEFRNSASIIWSSRDMHSLTKHQREKTLKSVLDKLLGKNDSIIITEMPSMTIVVDPETELLFLPSNIVTAINERRDIDLKKSDFKVILKNDFIVVRQRIIAYIHEDKVVQSLMIEYDAARERWLLNDDETKIEELLRYMESMEIAINTRKNHLQQIETHINGFTEKYDLKAYDLKAFDISDFHTMSNTDHLGISYVKEETRDILSDYYNIEIVRENE